MSERINAAHEGGSGAEEAIYGEENEGADEAGEEILAKAVRLREKLRYGESRGSASEAADRRIHTPLQRPSREIEGSREAPNHEGAERPEHDSGEDQRQERDRYLRVIVDRDRLPLSGGGDRAQDEESPYMRHAVAGKPEGADRSDRCKPQDAGPRGRSAIGAIQTFDQPVQPCVSPKRGIRWRGRQSPIDRSSQCVPLFASQPAQASQGQRGPGRTVG